MKLLKGFMTAALLGTALTGTCFSGNKGMCTSPTDTFDNSGIKPRGSVKQMHTLNYTDEGLDKIGNFDIYALSPEELLKKAKLLQIKAKSSSTGNTVDSLLQELEDSRRDENAREAVLKKVISLRDFGRDGNKTLTEKVDARLAKHKKGGQYGNMGLATDHERIGEFHKVIRATRKNSQNSSIINPQDKAAIQLTRNIVGLYQDGVLEGLNPDEIYKNLPSYVQKIVDHITSLAVENTEFKSKASSRSRQKTLVNKENHHAQTFDEDLNFSHFEGNERNNNSLLLNSISRIDSEQDESKIRQNEATFKITQGILELYRDGVLEGLNADEIEKDLLGNVDRILQSIAGLGVQASELQRKSSMRAFKQ